MKLDPERAPVRPRVFSATSGEAFLLEDEVLRRVEAGARDAVVILGPPGSGKTTALRHLAAVVPPGRVILVEEPDGKLLLQEFLTNPNRLLVCTLPADSLQQHPAALLKSILAVLAHFLPFEHTLDILKAAKSAYRLEPWGEDECIEYLLAAHRPHCASVMARVCTGDNSFLGGSPELWRPVLGRLAADPALPDPRRALHRYLEEHLTDTDLLERARSACLNAVAKPGADLLTALAGMARPGFADCLIRILRHPAVQNLLAAERVAADLHGSGDCDYLAERLPRELIQGAAALIAGDEEARDHLQRLLAGPPWSHAMSASLWHATGAGWEDGPQGLLELAGAYLEGVRWPGARLANASLHGADLGRADLFLADLSQANAVQVNLCQARLQKANLQNLLAGEANLAHANLSSARAECALFEDANLTRATLVSAVLCQASFLDAVLDGADFRDADLSEADLRAASLVDTDFAGVILRGTILSGLGLGQAHWEGARFAWAILHGCDLEGMTLSQANFEGAHLKDALLTGTTMRGANFRHANLRGAKLAEIDWEGACLAGADLTGATFHMGSTRSGLVSSPIACEGSRTGFYTDEYDEQTYKAPEEIRKANLCGADLRGARLAGVDFYLVDLRGARFDTEHEPHLRRSGAILSSVG